MSADSAMAPPSDDTVTIDDGETPLAFVDGDDVTDEDNGTERIRFSRKLEVLSDPSGTQSSAVGALRNHLAQQHLGLGRRSLAICSVGADVDRTLLSISLAIAAAQSGASTILIDANMRESRVGDYISLRGEGLGLSDFLSGATDDPGAIVTREILPNLSLVQAGSIPGDPQALLAGRRFEDLIQGVMRRYDFTIVDCPPSKLSADARRIASVVRYAMIVTKRDVTYVSDVKRLIEELTADRVTVLGTFLNVG